MPDTPAINGKHYDYAEISIDVGYGALVEAQEISYSGSQETESVHGKGRNPHGYGSGPWDGEGQLVITNDEFRNDFMPWVKGQGKKDPMELGAIDISVSYGDDNMPVVTDRLRRVKFQKVEMGGSVGDKVIKVTLPFKIHDRIDYGGGSDAARVAKAMGGV